jgi:hypothetical protein
MHEEREFRRTDMPGIGFHIIHHDCLLFHVRICAYPLTSLGLDDDACRSADVWAEQERCAGFGGWGVVGR